MPRKKKLVLFIATKEKITLQKEFFLTIHYFSLHKKLLLSKALKKKIQEKNTENWLITDTLSIIEIANMHGFKTILLANGREKIWHITPKSYPTFIASSIQQIQDFLFLIHFSLQK